MMHIFFVFISCLFSLIVGAQSSIQKAIYSGNYEKAKLAIDKELIKEPEDLLLNFSVAQFHLYDDNPYHQLPLAWKHINITESLFTKVKDEKAKQKLASQGIRPTTIQQLKTQIENKAFATSDSLNTVDAWELFIQQFNKSSKENIAIEKRNDLAYKQATEKFSYESFKAFMQRYPNAAQAPEAKKLYESLLYKNETAANTWQSFKSFIDNYPQSPYNDEALANYESLLFQEVNLQHTIIGYENFINQFAANRYVPQAEDSIYKMFITKGNADNYEKFIQQYPKNRNVLNAWMNMYLAASPHYSLQEIDSFNKVYATFPYKEQIAKDIQLCTINLQSFQDQELWGFKNAVTGEVIIKPQFEEVAEFSGRYAAVKPAHCVSGCKYTYVSRDGNLLSIPKYDEANDFINGFAIVGKGNCDIGECKYGLINQEGKLVLSFLFDEVFDATLEERILIKIQDKGYGYSNLAGEIVVPIQFVDAYSFSENIAAVKKDSLWGFIDIDGDFVIKAQYSNAGNFSNQLAPVADAKGLWGYINTAGLWVLPAKYHFANSFENGKAIVMLKEKNKKGIEIIIEKTIDNNCNILVPAPIKTTTTKPKKKK